MCLISWRRVEVVGGRERRKQWKVTLAIWIVRMAWLRLLRLSCGPAKPLIQFCHSPNGNRQRCASTYAWFDRVYFHPREISSCTCDTYGFHCNYDIFCPCSRRRCFVSPFRILSRLTIDTWLRLIVRRVHFQSDTNYSHLSAFDAKCRVLPFCKIVSIAYCIFHSLFRQIKLSPARIEFGKKLFVSFPNEYWAKVICLQLITWRSFRIDVRRCGMTNHH